MKTRLVAFVAALCLSGIAARAADSLVVEWTDRPIDAAWMPGGPVFQRTLTCWTTNREVCELVVITFMSAQCPTQLFASAFRSDTGDLKVKRTDRTVDLEFVSGLHTWTIHLRLTGSPPIVEHASGAVVTKPQLATAVTRSAGVIAIARNSTGENNIRELAEVKLACPSVSVVAAKKSK
jgi:hypothetical protein